MVKILGLPFDEYVDKQVEVRQAKLAKTTKDPEDLIVFNANTGWARLSSGVAIDSDRARTLSNRLGIPQTEIEKTGLAKKLVLWGGTTGLSSAGDNTVLDPLRGGVGYGINNAYGFLTTSDQGYKPMPGMVNMSCNYKNNGSLRQATVTIKCYSRSQFEALEAVYLRLGFTVVLEWGNTAWFNNNGEYRQTTAYSVPNLLFKQDGNVNLPELQQQVRKNKQNTAGNYDAMIAKVVNYSWDLGSDQTYGITLNLISAGDIIDSLKCNVNRGTVASTIPVSGSSNVQSLLTVIVNKQASQLNAFFYELYEQFKNPLQKEGSPETQAAAKTVDKIERALPTLESVLNRYLPIVDYSEESIRKYYKAFEDGLAAFNQRSGVTTATGESRITSVTFAPGKEAVQQQYTKAVTVLTLENDPQQAFLMFLNPNEKKYGADAYKQSLDRIRTYFDELKVTGDQKTLDLLNYLDSRPDPLAVIVRILDTGYIDPDKKYEVPGGQYSDGFGDYIFTNILEKTIGYGE